MTGNTVSTQPHVRQVEPADRAAGASPAFHSVGYTVAERSERRLALAVAMAAVLVAVAVAPISQLPAAVVPAFVPAVMSASVLAMALTASLLFAEYRAGGLTPLAVLGLAYAAAASLMLGYMLTFPGIFSPTGWLDAGPQTAAWLFVSWPFVFSALVVLHVAVEGLDAEQRARIIGRLALGTGALVVAIVLVTTLGHERLLGLVRGGKLTPLFHSTIAPAQLCVLLLTNAILIAKTRLRTRCHLWLSVVLLAMLLQMTMITFESSGRYSYGWYFARLELTLVSSIFLVVLQTQHMSILRRLNRSNERLERRNAEVESLIGLQDQMNRQLVDSEARYRALTDAMPQLVWIVDENATIKYVNARWAAYTGCTLNQSGAHGSAFMRDRNLYDEFLTTPDVAAAGHFECELRLRRSDGEFRWHRVRAVPFGQGNGIEGDWIVTATDIEARRKTEAELADLHVAALAATESKSRFLATMSHEIRTPMNGVIGMTELLLLTTLTPEQQQYVKTVYDSGRSLLRLINDILDYSKVEAGKLELDVVEFDIACELDSVVRLLAPQFESEGIRLMTRVDPLVPRGLLGDAGRLRQIIINLVANALKFTRTGGSVKIDISPGGAAGEHVPVRIVVQDSGIGMTQEVLDRLFQPFVQGDGSITRKYGGSGLGLSICAQLVTLMNGAIGAESEPGSGSSFWFLVPFGVVQAERAPAESSFPAERGELELALERTPNILLVEDNAINTRLALAQFKKLGLVLNVAVNGRRAVEAVQQQDFDIVFMDCHMPEMDGFAATREIRRLEADKPRRTPIVAMTADARVEDHDRCLSAGMDDYLSKPTSLATLRPVIERWLQRSGAA